MPYDLLRLSPSYCTICSYCLNTSSTLASLSRALRPPPLAQCNARMHACMTHAGLCVCACCVCVCVCWCWWFSLTQAGVGGGRARAHTQTQTHRHTYRHTDTHTDTHSGVRACRGSPGAACHLCFSMSPPWVSTAKKTQVNSGIAVCPISPAPPPSAPARHTTGTGVSSGVAFGKALV